MTSSSEHFTELLKTFCDHWVNDSQCDVVLFGSDGTLNAHRIILSATSDVFRQALAGNSSAGITHISLPDIDIETMQIAVSFMYIGVLVLPTSHQTSSKLSMLLHSLLELGLDRERLMNSNAIFISDYAEGGWQRLIKQHLVDTSKDLSFVQFRELYSSVLGEEAVVANVAGLIKKEEDTGTETETLLSTPLNSKDASAAASRKILVTFQCQSCGLRFHDRSQYNEHREEHARKLAEASKSGALKVDSDVESGQATADTPDCLEEGESGSVAENSEEASKTVDAEAVDLDSDAQADTDGSSKAKKENEDDEQEESVVSTKKTKKGGVKRKRRTEGEGEGEEEGEGEGSYKCEICPRTFRAKFNFERHVKMHSGTKEHLCHHCGKAFIQKSSLKEHITHQHGRSGKQRASRSEPAAESTEGTLEEGVVAEDAGAVKSETPANDEGFMLVEGYLCFACGLGFKDEAELMAHNPCPSLSDGNELTCEYCQRSFTIRSRLLQHIASKHDKTPKSFECLECGRTFSQQSTLKAHERRHTGERDHQCFECGKTFTSKSILQQHLNIHTGERPHQCAVCDKAFAHKETLVVHMRIHTGEKPSLIHTGERPHQCAVCDKAFAHKETLVVHMRIHTGEKPFQCQVCGTSYTQAHHLKGHMLTHTGVKPFQCDHCSKSYKNRVDLRFHCLRVHQIDIRKRPESIGKRQAQPIAYQYIEVSPRVS